MKKTTTRLATIAAVLVMSAFAIILAQHDARKRVELQEPLAIASVSNEPTEPISSSLIWPGKNPIVRGNSGNGSESHQSQEEDSLQHSGYSSKSSGDTAFSSETGRSSGDTAFSSASSGDTAFSSETGGDSWNGVNSGTGGNSANGGDTAYFRGGDRESGADIVEGTAVENTLRAEMPSGDEGQLGGKALPVGKTQGGEALGDTAFTDQKATQIGGSFAQFDGSSLVENNTSAATGGVVAASGEQPALPSWLPGGSAATSNLPPVSGTSANGVRPSVVSGSDNTSIQGSLGSSAAVTVSPRSQTAGSASLPEYPVNTAQPHSTPVATLSSPQPVSTGQPKSPGLLPISGLSSPSSQELPFQSTNSSPPAFPNQGLPTLPTIPGPTTTGPNMPGTTSSPNAFSASAASSSQQTLAAASSGFSSQPQSASSERSIDTGMRAALVSNQPGSRFLDGSQNPVMQIQKRAPDEIQVGKKATFVITVRNAGTAAAHEVTVVDRVPQGARFVESSPSISPTTDGLLAWSLGEMAPGDERTISLQLIPEVEGEVGSVATVQFAALASVRTVATLPQVVLQLESVAPVIIGQSQQLVVNIENSGSGVARGVRLEADIPAQLRHESGETQLEALVGDLRPSESRRLTLAVAAIQPGQSQCLLRAVNDDGVLAEQAISIDVRAPQLAASISGPSLRYLERQASYQVVVSNTGTAAARNLDFVVHLPVGLKFISADIPQANYDPQSHSVALGLAELDTGQSAPFAINVLPVQLGAQVIRFNGTGDLGIATEAKAQVTVAGLAELSFTIGQDNGTVEVGASTTYAVQVSNIGNQPDKNVQLVVQLPEGTNLMQVDAPVEYQVEAGKIVFAPVAEMRNRDVQTFRFQIQHNRAGNQVVRSQLTSANWPVAVVKEEGTLVYNDRN